MAFGRKSSAFKKGSKNLSKKSFDVQDLLANGSFGIIFTVKKNRGTNKNQIFAMKVLHKQNILTPNKIQAAEAEVKALKKLDHPFVIELRYAFQDKYNLFIVMEYASNGNLASFIERQNVLTPTVARYYMRELVLAVEYMHSQNVLHRDIQPNNILINSRGHVKLADFGRVTLNFTDECVKRDLYGTPAFIAPEYYSMEVYGRGLDWWALGITFYCMVFGELPVKGKVERVLNGDIPGGPFTAKLSTRSLITELKRKEPTQRLGQLGAEQVKSHQYFAGTCWDNVLKNTQHDSPYLWMFPINEKEPESLIHKFKRFVFRENNVETWFPKCSSCVLKFKEYNYDYEEEKRRRRELKLHN